MELGEKITRNKIESTLYDLQQSMTIFNPHMNIKTYSVMANLEISVDASAKSLRNSIKYSVFVELNIMIWN